VRHTESPSTVIPPFSITKDSEHRVAQLQRRLEDMFGELHVVHGVITVSIETMHAQVSGFDPEVGCALFQYGGKKPYERRNF
jgi:hypothetical protein